MAKRKKMKSLLDNILMSHHCSSAQTLVISQAPPFKYKDGLKASVNVKNMYYTNKYIHTYGYIWCDLCD